MCYLCDEERAATAPKTVEAVEVKEVPTARVLTRETLMKARPCDKYSVRFAKRFPVSVEVTVELAVAQAADWDWDWAADMLLTGEGCRAYNTEKGGIQDKFTAVLEPYRAADEAVEREYYAVRERVMAETHNLGLRNSERYARIEAATEGLGEVERAALEAVRGVIEKGTAKALASAWAEIYISENDEGLFAARRAGACDCGECRSDW